MRSRNPAAALAASPTMVGAVTTLIVIVAVFLAYNANQGLPFVPVYRVSIEVPNASRLVPNNEVRIGGSRVGVVESIEPVVDEEANRTAQTEGGDTGLPVVAAQLNLKLDESAAPLPKDSVFRVRYRSSFGLKYLEIVRGTGEPAPEGYIFDGTNDSEAPGFVGCDLPTNPETFSGEIPEQAQDGCFQPQIEFDAINNTFDTETRENIRVNLLGYGDAFAGRGMSLNDAIEGLRPLFENLGPVSRVLSDADTQLARFFREMADTARIVAPVSDQQAQFFANAATAFAAMSADPDALQQTISEGPPTLRTAIDTLPRQRPFLAEFAELSRRLRPGVRELRIALPTLNRAIVVGTPILRRTPALNRRLRGALVELRRLVDQPTTKVALERLRETFGEARPLLRWVVPAQTVCNYWNYWFTFVPNGLSDRDQIGYNFRQTLVSAPLGELHLALGPLEIEVPGEVQGPLGGYSGIQANGKTGAAYPNDDPSHPSPFRPEGEFRPLEIPILHGNPYAPTGQPQFNQGGRPDCQPGQTGYPLGDLRIPGQPRSNPTVGIADLPGARGVTTAFFNDANELAPRDTRVEARQP